MNQRQKLSVSLVGQELVGKSSLALQFCFNVFPTDHDPTIDDWYQTQKWGTRIEIRDTNGQFDSTFRRMRIMSIQSSQVVILVYDLSDVGSVLNLDRFVSEIHAVHPTPFVLVVGNKSDLVTEDCEAKDLGQTFAACHGWPHMIVSARKNSDVLEMILTCIQGVKCQERERVQIDTQTQSCCDIL